MINNTTVENSKTSLVSLKCVRLSTKLLAGERNPGFVYRRTDVYGSGMLTHTTVI